MRYTIDEIDEMREILTRIYLGVGEEWSVNMTNMNKAVEERLRTYLAAGVHLREVKDKEEQMWTDYFALLDKHIEWCKINEPEKSKGFTRKTFMGNNLGFSAWYKESDRYSDRMKRFT